MGDAIIFAGNYLKYLFYNLKVTDEISMVMDNYRI